MELQISHQAALLRKEGRVADALSQILETELRARVESLAYPRSVDVQPRENEGARDWIAAELESFGLAPVICGAYDNVVAWNEPCEKRPCVIVGAHYDSVARTPGADDNASAVAAMLSCARVLAGSFSDLPVCFAAFNGEEVTAGGTLDSGLRGSRDLVGHFLVERGFRVRVAHVMEMVGFATDAPGSQRMPEGFPIQAPDTGNFLALLANPEATPHFDLMLSAARTYLPGFPAIGLVIPPVLAQLEPHVLRSDHAAFWERGLPATMLTDTAEFRNPHYHEPTDTPETLDYPFLRRVAQLILAGAIHSAMDG